MKRILVAIIWGLAIPLVACIANLANASSDNPDDGKIATGLWRWSDDSDGSEIVLTTMNNGDLVHFQLKIYNGVNHHSGFIEGDFPIKKNEGIFYTNKFGDCKISFSFSKEKAQIHDSSNGCGFGMNVFAEGELINLGHAEPNFSDGDLRFSK